MRGYEWEVIGIERMRGSELEGWGILSTFQWVAKYKWWLCHDQQQILAGDPLPGSFHYGSTLSSGAAI